MGRTEAPGLASRALGTDHWHVGSRWGFLVHNSVRNAACQGHNGPGYLAGPLSGATISAAYEQACAQRPPVQ